MRTRKDARQDEWDARFPPPKGGRQGDEILTRELRLDRPAFFSLSTRQTHSAQMYAQRMPKKV